MAQVTDFIGKINDIVGDCGDNNAVETWIADGCNDVVRRVTTANPLLLEKFASESGSITSATTDIDETVRKIHMVYRTRAAEVVGNEILLEKNQNFDATISTATNSAAIDGDWIHDTTEPDSNVTIDRSTDQKQSGTHSAILTLSGTGAGVDGSRLVALKETGLTVDVPYRFSLYGHEGTGTGVVLKVSETWNGANIAESSSLTTDGDWESVSVDFVATATTMYLQVYVIGTDGQTEFIDDLSLKEIDAVGVQINCRKVTPTIGKLMASNPRSVYYTNSTSDPIYYIHNELLNIYPAPTATDAANYTFVPRYAITNPDSSTTSIDGFPLSYYDHVVTYAAMMSAQRQMRDQESNLPSDVVLPVLSPPTLEDISNLSLPIAPTSPSSPNITSPGVDSVTLSNIGIPPTYTTPTVGGDGNELTDLSALDAEDTLDVSAESMQFDQWFAAVAHYIEDEEDTELAQTQLGKISTYISAYQAEVQNQLNKFNKENAEYQAKLSEAQAQAQINQQEAQKEADLTFQATIQDYTLELQKYQADMSKYQAEVNAVVQKWSNEEISNKMAKWSTEYSNKLTEYANELQAKVAEHSRKLEKTSANYKWLQQQYDMLYRKYETMFATEGLSVMKSKGE